MLTEPVVAFLRSWDSLGQRCVQHPWGTVTGDTRYPDVHDANRSLVTGPASPALADVQASLAEMHAQVPVGFDQVEVVDVAVHARLMEDLGVAFGPAQRFVLMHRDTGTPPPAAPPGVRVVEREPEDATSALLMAAFASEAPSHVIPQLSARRREVFVAAGARTLLASVGATLAGMATVLVLEDVALIDDVVTLPEHRRCGVATAATLAAMRAASGRGARDVLLFTAEDGVARHVYERLGFTVLAVAAQHHRER